jgi:hypothetical protein
MTGRVAATFVGGDPVFVNEEVFPLGLHMGVRKVGSEDARAEAPKRKAKGKSKDKTSKAARRKK